VKVTESAVKPNRKRFLLAEKSASAPSTGESSATTSMAIPTEIPHSREPSAPPTTCCLK